MKPPRPRNRIVRPIETSCAHLHRARAPRRASSRTIARRAPKVSLARTAPRLVVLSPKRAPPDVIRMRRGVVAAGARNLEDVSDAAALQFARSTDAIYGEAVVGRGAGLTRD